MGLLSRRRKPYVRQPRTARYTAPMSGKEDVEFLAVLVHRGHLEHGVAKGLFDRLKAGADLDELLQLEVGWDVEVVEKLRRTRGGEIPEIPGYSVVGRLGTGGTADVFRVEEKKTGRRIALKVLKPKSTQHTPTRKAFIGEARLLERLSHPGLVTGYGVARSGQTYFARMECIDGRTLLEMLDEGQAFDETTALRIVLSVAETLDYLASEGVIHRDVKPGNIMFDSNGAVKLIDLGFAAEADEAPVDCDSTVGTVEYLSPEQARGGAVADARCDIYSLGVTLFHLVVGHLPFESSDDREVLRMQVMESLSSPELKSRGHSHYLHYFIEKMMAKEAEERYQSWSELTDDIKGQLEGRDSLDFDRDLREQKAARQPARGTTRGTGRIRRRR